MYCLGYQYMEEARVEYEALWVVVIYSGRWCGKEGRGYQDSWLGKISSGWTNRLMFGRKQCWMKEDVRGDGFWYAWMSVS